MKMIFFLMVSLFISSTALSSEKINLFTKDELKVIYLNNFNSLDVKGIKKVGDVYFILSSVYAIGFDHERRLEAKAKRELLRYFSPHDKKISAVKIRAFFKGATWRKNGRVYLLSYIRGDNVVHR